MDVTNAEDMKIKIRAFIRRFFKKREFSDSEDIFLLGFVNSLFAMQMVMFLEKEFSIRIEKADMDMKNFSSVDSIAMLINAKKSALNLQN